MEENGGRSLFRDKEKRARGEIQRRASRKSDDKKTYQCLMHSRRMRMILNLCLNWRNLLLRGLFVAVFVRAPVLALSMLARWCAMARSSEYNMNYDKNRI
jgi:hypothetical protein